MRPIILLNSNWVTTLPNVPKEIAMSSEAYSEVVICISNDVKELSKTRNNLNIPAEKQTRMILDLPYMKNR